MFFIYSELDDIILNNLVKSRNDFGKTEWIVDMQSVWKEGPSQNYYDETYWNTSGAGSAQLSPLWQGVKDKRGLESTYQRLSQAEGRSLLCTVIMSRLWFLNRWKN